MIPCVFTAHAQIEDSISSESSYMGSEHEIPQPEATVVTVVPALPLPVGPAPPAPLPVKCGVAVASFIVALLVVNISQVGCIVLGWFVAWYYKWPEVVYPFCMGLGWILVLLILTGLGIIICGGRDSPLRWIIRILVLVMMIAACIVSIVKFAHGATVYSGGIAFFGVFSVFQGSAPPSIAQCFLLTWQTLAIAPFRKTYSRLTSCCSRNQ